MLHHIAKTAFEHAFGLAGGPTRAEARFALAIAEYWNNGGTYERGLELYNAAAERLPRDGHAMLADTGQIKLANARQPNDDAEGQKAEAINGHDLVAKASSPIASGEGQTQVVETDQSIGAAPAREPSAADLAAMAMVRKKAAASIFDRETTRTNQAWGNVKYIDLDAFVQDADIALAIKHYIGQLPRHEDRLKPIRELMTPTQFAAALRKAKRDA